MTGKELWGSILQKAMEGKLVPQRKEEGTAAELLKEIRKEKAKLVKEGKLKKTKPLPAVREEEKPFHIPDSWEWVRLGEVGELIRGSGIKRSDVVKLGKPCIRYGELYTTYKTRFSKVMSFTTVEVFNKCHKVHHNDILMSLTGENKWDIALAVTYEGNEEIAMGGDMTKWTNHRMNPLYLTAVMNSPYGIGCKRSKATGDIIVHISNSKLGEILLPIPPLAEQHRIVDKLETLKPLVDAYGQAAEELDELNRKFPGDLKKSLLHQAMEGKLVSQRKEEGTAAELLQEIRKEKAKLLKEGKLKKTKPLPAVSKEEKPFDIPDSWEWVRIGQIFSLQAGKNITASEISKNRDEKHLYLCYGGNGIRGYVGNYNNEGDFPLIGRQGALCGNINRANGKFYATEHAVVTHTFADTNISWACYFLKALNLNQYATATAQPGLAVSKVNTVLIPLPPQAEQQRIVEKLESLLALCDKLQPKD